MAIFKKTTELKEQVTDNSAKLKYARPKTLAIDIDKKTVDAIAQEGFNIVAGTFGAPYKVEKSSSYKPVIANLDLPNHTEQEIIIVDLLTPDTQSDPQGKKHSPDEELDWWAKCNLGAIDPRPRAMAWAQDDFERIYNSGGVFVIFSDRRITQDIKWAYKPQGYSSINTKTDLPYDNWSLLKIFDELIVTDDHGMEITTVPKKGPLINLLADHLNNAKFSCTLEPRYGKKQWVPLAHNKYGADVAGFIAPLEDSNKGWIFIFPQIQNKQEFLIAFLKNILPEIAPGLFPNAEGQKWIHRPEYELPTVIEKEKEISAIEIEMTKKIETLNSAIQSEQQANKHFYDLLRETGDELVVAVHKVFEIIGFTKIIDVDKERDKEGKSRREDLQIHDQLPTLIVDIKGIGGYPSDDDVRQAEKHATLRMKEWRHTDVVGLSIINHQRHLPPLDRGNTMPFRQELLEYATSSDLGLMTTWDLYRIVRNIEKNKWPSKVVKPLFYHHGRIEVLPTHYQFLGKIEKAWTDKFGVVIENGELQIGDRIAIEFPVEFEELPVESMRVNNVNVQFAKQGDPVGMLWSDKLPKLREGMRVFRIPKT